MIFAEDLTSLPKFGFIPICGMKLKKSTPVTVIELTGLMTACTEICGASMMYNACVIRQTVILKVD